MSQVYGYRKPVRRSRMHRHYLALTVLFLVALGVVAGAFFYDEWRNKNQQEPLSQVQTQTISPEQKTFRSGYFQFKDSGNWVLNTNESTKTKYIYYKYQGLLVEHQLVVYVNEVPIPLYLAVARALPVRIVNGDSFDVTTVSDPCGKLYSAGELHKIKTLSINEASILCDPDTPQYSVVLSEINGDYRLGLKRLDGSSLQFVITYRNMTLEPGPNTIKKIAATFQAL